MSSTTWEIDMRMKYNPLQGATCFYKRTNIQRWDDSKTKSPWYMYKRKMV